MSTRLEGLEHLHPSCWSNQRLELAIVAYIGLLVAMLADRQAYWVDERTTIALLGRWTPVEMLTQLTVYQPHLPTWFIIVDVVGPGWGQGLSLVSLPVASIAAYGLARQFDSHHRSLLAALLVSTSPYLASQASWIRMYALLTATMTVGLWLAYERRYGASLACLGLGALLHPFGAFGPAWLAWRLLATDEAMPRRLAAIGTSLLPLAALLAVNITPSGFTVQSTGVGHGVIPTPLEFILTPLGALSGTMQTPYLEIVPAVVVTAVLVWRWPDRDLAMWIVLPVVGAAFASLALHPVYTLKYFGFIAPAVAVGAVTGPRSRLARSTVITVLVVLYVTTWIEWLAGVAVARAWMIT